MCISRVRQEDPGPRKVDNIQPGVEDKHCLPLIRSKYEELKARSARLKIYEESPSGSAAENPVPARTSPNPLPVGTIRGLDGSDAEDRDLDVNPLVGGFTNMTISPSGREHYLGWSNSTVLGRRLRDMVGFSTSQVALDIDKDYSTYKHSAIRLRRPSFAENGRQVRLPQHLHAHSLFAAQHSYIGTIFAFVQADEFERRLQKAYQGPPELTDRKACLEYCQILIIFAFGKLYMVNESDHYDADGPPGFEYFQEALQFLPDLHEEGSVLFVSVLSLIGYFMQNLNRRDAAFLYVGTALRMSISLALHQEADHLDNTEREHRRRLWWSVYSLDRILCVKSGNPITIHDEDINVAMPLRLSHEAEYCPAICLRHYTQLSRILGRIMQAVYRKTRKSGKSLIASVQDIMTALADWDKNLPPQLRFDPEMLSVSRESVSVFLHYHQCINLTARPLLFHIVQKQLDNLRLNVTSDWKLGLSPNTIAVVELCIRTARDTIAMMTVAAQTDLVATYGYMDGEHAFSAAIVLVMVCVALPLDVEIMASMDSALELLRGMAERGNKHIGARYLLLMQLRSLIEPPVDPPQVQSTVDFPFGAVPEFPLVDNMSIENMLAGDMNMDVEFWAEVCGNMDFNPIEKDFNQWTETAYGH